MTAGVAALALATVAPLAASSSGAVGFGHNPSKHVLLISVDGMHQSDLDWYVANHPGSELAGWPTAAPSTPMRRPPTRRTLIRPARGS